MYGARSAAVLCNVTINSILVVFQGGQTVEQRWMHTNMLAWCSGEVRTQCHQLPFITGP